MLGIKREGKIRTPISTLNIAGGGGFAEGSIIELWGGNKAGKSTASFQTGELFLKDFGDEGILLILDAENSSDLLRLRRVFNISPGYRISIEGEWEEIEGGDERVILAPAMTVESATAHFMSVVSKYKESHVLAIWDSITASAPQSEWDNTMEALEKDKAEDAFAGGMMAKPRSLSKAFGKIMGIQWANPRATLIIINQERVKVGRYTTGVMTTGGKAVEHAKHYSLHFEFGEKLKENEFFKKGTKSTVTVVKSKYMPYLSDIPIFINDKLGGKLESKPELLEMAKELGVVKYVNGWFKINGKNTRAADALTDKEFIRTCYKGMVKMMRETYALVNFDYEENIDIQEDKPVKKKKKLKKKRKPTEG